MQEDGWSPVLFFPFNVSLFYSDRVDYAVFVHQAALMH